MSDVLRVIVPYGRVSASNHFAYNNKQGDRTLCGRECYGWSIIRRFEGDDVKSAYSCKKCVGAL